MRRCPACGQDAHDHVLIVNDGLCHDCKAKSDKYLKDKETQTAYEYMVLDRHLDKFIKRKAS